MKQEPGSLILPENLIFRPLPRPALSRLPEDLILTPRKSHNTARKRHSDSGDFPEDLTGVPDPLTLSGKTETVSVVYGPRT